MKDLATHRLALTSTATSAGLLDNDLSPENTSCSAKLPTNADLVTEYLNALRRGVVLSG